MLTFKIEDLQNKMEDQANATTPKIETTEVEVQTDLDMEHFENLIQQQLRGNGSRGSHDIKKGSQNSQRVGGGGSVAGRPPRNPSGGVAAQSKKDIADLNVQGERKSSKNTGRNSGNETQKSLPNLLKTGSGRENSVM